MKKYELTEEYTLTMTGKKVYRIKALKDFRDVKSGDLGGWIESEKNLSQDETCWVYDDAMVFDNAYVSENARVANHAKVFNNAHVHGNAVIGCDVLVYDNAEVFDNAQIIYGAKICKNAKVHGVVHITDCCYIHGNAEICGMFTMRGIVAIGENAIITKNADYITTYGLGNTDAPFTFFKTKENDIYVDVCGFCYSFKEFIEKRKNKECQILIDLVKYHFSEEK